LTGTRLLTLHNLTYMERLVSGGREAITAGRFADYSRAVLDGAAPWRPAVTAASRSAVGRSTGCSPRPRPGASRSAPGGCPDDLIEVDPAVPAAAGEHDEHRDHGREQQDRDQREQVAGDPGRGGAAGSRALLLRGGDPARRTRWCGCGI
jgi:hypothetical protein